MFDEVEWVDFNSLSIVEIRAAASWVNSMDADYYRLFYKNRAESELVIQSLFSDTESEFGTMKFIRRNQELVGFANWFKSSEIFSRRIRVLKVFLARNPEPEAVKAKLKEYRGASIANPFDSIYLSKIYITKGMRGSGLSDYVMKQFISTGLLLKKDLTMHVAVDNSAAILLYKKHGFSNHPDVAGSEGEYILMHRKGGD